MTIMVQQISLFRVDSRSIVCMTASDWLLVGLLRRCDPVRTAKINTSLTSPSRHLHSCVRQTPPRKRSRKCPTTLVTTAAAQPESPSQELIISTTASLDSSPATAQQQSNTKMNPLPTKKKNPFPRTRTKSASSDTAQAPLS